MVGTHMPRVPSVDRGCRVRRLHVARKMEQDACQLSVPPAVPPNLPRYGTQTPKSGRTIASFRGVVYPAGWPFLRPITDWKSMLPRSQATIIQAHSAQWRKFVTL